MRLLRVLLFILCSSQVFAASWYVDGQATGLKNGTSWANAWTNLYGVAGIAAGDTVYISASSTNQTYYLPSYWVSPVGGTAGNPVTFAIGQDAAHNGIATFDGGGTNQFFWSGSLNYITFNGAVSNQNHLVLQNFAFAFGNISADDCHNMTVQNIDFRNSNYRNHTGTNQIIAYCNWYITNLDHAVNLAVNATNATIHNNVFWVSRDSGGGNGDDCVQWGGDGSSFYSNVCMGVAIGTNYTAGQHQDGWQVWASNLRIHDNYFFNMGNSATFVVPASGATYDITNVWIYNNVLENCSEDLAVGNNNNGTSANWHNLVVANNTVSDGLLFNFLSGAGTGSTNVWFSDVLIANNILWNSGPLNVDPAITSVGNVTIQSVAGLNYFVKYTTASGANISTNQYDFRLEAADPFIGAGTNLTSLFTNDYAGSPRPSVGAWDVGAYQYSSSPISPASSQTVLGWGKYGWMRIGN